MSKYERKSPRIVSEVLEDISAGRLRPGEQFLTLAQLAERYDVSPNTASQVIKTLKGLGALSGRSGGRTWVRVPPAMAVRRNTRYHEEKANVHAIEAERAAKGVSEYDSGISIQDLHEVSARYEVMSPPEDIAAVLQLAEGGKVLRRSYYRRHAQGAGISGSTSYIPYELVAGNPELLDASREPWPGGTMHQLWTVGIEIGEIEDRILSDMPTAEEAADFDIPPGVSMFRLRKVSYDIDGRPVEVADIPLPGDRTELIYKTRLERWA